MHSSEMSDDDCGDVDELIVISSKLQQMQLHHNKVFDDKQTELTTTSLPNLAIINNNLRVSNSNLNLAKVFVYPSHSYSYY